MQPLQDAYGNTLEIGDWIMFPDYNGALSYLHVAIIADVQDEMWISYCPIGIVTRPVGINYTTLDRPGAAIKINPRSVPLSIRTKILDSIQDNPGALHADRCKLALWNEPMSSL